jgi:hypothetical protein
MVTDDGALTSEDADISNVKASEILVRRKPKVSWATMFVPGLVGSLAEAEWRRRCTAGQYSCTGLVKNTDAR